MGGIIRKHHKHVGFGEWMRIALPATIAALVVSSAFIWFVFS
jgi:Na+/H+ antiporter NhaD/arsenite permease-like protein